MSATNRAVKDGRIDARNRCANQMAEGAELSVETVKWGVSPEVKLLRSLTL